MRITRKPNPQLKQIVLDETNDGRDVVRYLKSTFMEIEDALGLFGLSPKQYARTHKIAAARILARIGLEEGKRYLRRNYVQTPFKRVHPEDEDLPRREMAASTSDLYRLVKKETNDGRDIIIRFVEIMKGYHPEYKPHLRLAAAKELIRHIEFDYEDDSSPSTNGTSPSIEPVGASPVDALDHDISSTETEPVEASLVGALEQRTATSDESATTSGLTESSSPAADRAQNPTTTQAEPTETVAVSPTNLVNPGSHSPANPYRAYADLNCADEAESIYQSIVRRASDRPTLGAAKFEAAQLVSDFNKFAAERDPEFTPIAVPDELLARSLTQRMEDPESYIFDPAEYYEFDRDDFYFCMCRGCEDCDELDFFIEFMRELEEETDYLFEDT